MTTDIKQKEPFILSRFADQDKQILFHIAYI